MMHFVEKWAWIKAMRPSIPIDGLSSLIFLREHLLHYIGHDEFEQLEKAFYVGATNLNDGTLESINTGFAHQRRYGFLFYSFGIQTS